MIYRYSHVLTHTAHNKAVPAWWAHPTFGQRVLRVRCQLSKRRRRRRRRWWWWWKRGRAQPMRPSSPIRKHYTSKRSCGLWSGAVLSCLVLRMKNSAWQCGNWSRVVATHCTLVCVGVLRQWKTPELHRRGLLTSRTSHLTGVQRVEHKGLFSTLTKNKKILM